MMLTVCLLALLAGAASAVSSPCSEPNLPLYGQGAPNHQPNKRHGNSPIFQLNLRRDTGNTTRAGAVAYRVELTVKNRFLSFTAAEIAVTSTGACGLGKFYYDERDFRLEGSASCPAIVFNRTSKSLRELPFMTWTPPSCGCVQFRAVVVEAGSRAYADSAFDSNGKLTRTVCVNKQKNRETYIKALCQARSRTGVSEVLHRTSFLQRHDYDIRWMDKAGVANALGARHHEIGSCCDKKTNTARSRCLDRIRLHRVDAFCEAGYPDVAFTSLRRQHMREREKSCCIILGSFRYSCFKQGSQLQYDASQTSLFDFSLDETDPINDLADFATSQDTDILSFLGQLDFNATLDPSPLKMDGAWIRVQGQVVMRDEEDEEADILDADDDDDDDDNDAVGEPKLHRKVGPREDSNAELKRHNDGKSVERKRENDDKSTEHRGRKNGRGSAERRRKNRGRSVESKRNGRFQNINEKPEVVRHRSPGLPPRDLSVDMVDPPSFDRGGGIDEEDGGSSLAEEDLLGINREIQYLKTMRQCCLEGTQVYIYGSVDLRQIREICWGEADRYAQTLDSWKKKCVRKFRYCCINNGDSFTQALTSQEHREVLGQRIQDTTGISDIPTPYETQGLERRVRGRDVEEEQRVELGAMQGEEIRVFQRQELGLIQGDELKRNQEALLARSHAQGRDLQAELDLESEARYQSMRSSAPPVFSGAENEQDGPARFDDLDNRRAPGDVHGLQKHHSPREKNGGVVPRSEAASEEVDEHDDRDFVGEHEDDEDEDEDKDEDEDEDEEDNVDDARSADLARTVMTREASMKQVRLRSHPSQRQIVTSQELGLKRQPVSSRAVSRNSQTTSRDNDRNSETTSREVSRNSQTTSRDIDRNSQTTSRKISLKKQPSASHELSRKQSSRELNRRRTSVRRHSRGGRNSLSRRSQRRRSQGGRSRRGRGGRSRRGRTSRRQRSSRQMSSRRRASRERTSRRRASRERTSRRKASRERTSRRRASRERTSRRRSSKERTSRVRASLEKQYRHLIPKGAPSAIDSQEMALLNNRNVDSREMIDLNRQARRRRRRRGRN